VAPEPVEGLVEGLVEGPISSATDFHSKTQAKQEWAKRIKSP